MKQITKDIENAFFADGYRLGMKVTETDIEASILFSSIREMHEITDKFIDSLVYFAKQNNQKIDCKKNCYWCCYQPVFALDYELEYLNHFIKQNFSLELQQNIRKKARDKNKRLEGLTKNEILNSKVSCPLLHEGECLAYSARPIACRIYLSTNVKTCQTFYNMPDDKNQYPTLLDFPMRAGRMMNEGFNSALKISGLKSEEFRIEEKLTD